MACKLKCPECKRVIKEKDDHSKSAQGEYIVHPKGETNDIECCCCGHISDVENF